MQYNYKKLWKLLIDLDMSKKELVNKARVSGTTLARLKNGSPVTIKTLARICDALNCTVEDIMEIKQED